MQHEQFYERPSDASIAKIKIVVNYFSAWTKVILPQAKKRADSRIAFLDLFCGPGRYKNGNASTPLWILGTAVKDEKLRNHLVLHFNDVNRKSVETLQQEITAFPDADRLHYRPTVTNFEVGREIAETLSETSMIPTLFFIDPWGYKGLSLDLIGSAIQHWGCDCIFFFNYNRVNPGISNPMVEELIDDLFGCIRAAALRNMVRGITGHDREMIILNEMAKAIRDSGGKWVLPFTFRNKDGRRTSHHLIFVSKHFRGFDIMKNVMAKLGTTAGGDSVRFEFNRAPSIQLGLLDEFNNELRMEELEAWLMDYFTGREVRVDELYEEHEISRNGTGFRKADYKKAIRRLEERTFVFLDIEPERRQKRGGEVTVGDKRVVYFPSAD